MFPRRPWRALLGLALLLAPAAGPAPAPALVAPVQPVDGPSTAIRELGGVAMSADGTGGLVYRKDDADGRPHIFAAQFVDGAWRPPQRVDTGSAQRFESSWPVIAAGDGGRLLVVWVQEFGAADRMFSASLQPGSRRFEPPVPVDLNVGDSALGTYPAVSMAPGGQAYLTYRVVTDAQPATVPPGNVLGEYRLARYTGQLWSGFGAPVNRNPAAGQPVPAEANRPQIGADQLGNAVLAWQELDDDFVPRVYARRIFSGSTGIAVQVTPRELDGRVVRAGADQFSLDVGRFGEAVVAWRQQPADGAGFARARALAAVTPDVFSPDAATFGAPFDIDGDGAEGPEALGPLSAAAAGPSRLALFGAGTAVLATDFSDTAGAAPMRLDAGGLRSAADPQADLAGSGAAALAWKVDPAAGARGGLLVRERRADGVTTDRTLAAPRGGVVDVFRLAGSGLGDALVAFTQGTGAGRQVAAGLVDAPPDVFNAQAPLDWVRADRVEVAWDPARHAVRRISYAVVVDDEVVADGLRGERFALPLADVADGRRAVTVVATDDAGQETTSVAADLKVDRRPPGVSVRVRGRVARVVVSDGRGRSGVSAAETRITWGDGARAAGRARAARRYRRPGRYRVSVKVRDRAGNAATVRRSVVVR